MQVEVVREIARIGGFIIQIVVNPITDAVIRMQVVGAQGQGKRVRVKFLDPVDNTQSIHASTHSQAGNVTVLPPMDLVTEIIPHPSGSGDLELLVQPAYIVEGAD